MLSLCQLDQGVMVSTCQKAMTSLSSAPNTTDAAAQTGCRQKDAATQVSGCEMCSALTPVLDNSGETAVGGVPR